MLSTVYAAIARRRREFYAGRPDLRRRLRRPVISVGNLAVGGRGKTPTVACLAKELLAMGERPAILSRGYARRQPDDGVVIVRDADGIRADLDRAGDEPLMLARQLPGVSVLCCSERYLAGRLAETHLGATVHVLDDGFQHLQLDRDVDLVIVAGEDLADDARTLPSGRLREAPDSLLAADAILATDEAVLARGPSPRHSPFEVFKMRRLMGTPLSVEEGAASGRVFAMAGIARPARFLRWLARVGLRRGRDAGLSRSLPLFPPRPRPGVPGGQGRRGRSRPDNGEGLRAPAAVPAVSARGGLGATYNGAGFTARVSSLACRCPCRRPRSLARPC